MSDAERLADPFNRDTAVQDGGGIFSAGTLNVSDTTIGVGLAGDDFGSRGHQGGGIFISGTMTLADSTIESNTALGFGGGIFNSGTANVTSSTVAYNTTIYGGGVFNSGRITITNSTISGNITYPPSSSYYYTYSSGEVDGSTGISTTLQGSIVANSTGVPDLYGTISGNHNLIDDYSYNSLSGTNNLWAAADLESLGNYGGPTQTMPPVPGSPAIAEGASFNDQDGNPIESDQRGLPMPTTVTPDIGAVQTSDGTTVPLAPTGLGTTVASSTEIDLGWTDHAASSVGDIIYASTDNGSTFYPIDEINSVSAGSVNSYQATGLNPGSHYEFYVITDGGYLQSPASATASASTTFVAPTLDVEGTGTVVEGQPYELDLTATYPDGEPGVINHWAVDWHDGTGGASHVVNYSYPPGADPTQPLVVNYTFNAGIASPTVTITAVDSVNGSFSADDQPVAVTPIAPTSQTASAVSQNEIDLGWTNNSSIATGTVIFESTDGSNFNPVYEVAQGVSGYHATNLNSDNHYWFEFETDSENGQSDPSAIVNSWTTRAQPQLLVSPLTAPTEGQSFGLSLEWKAVPAEPAADNIVQWQVDWGDGTGLHNFTASDSGSSLSESNTYAMATASTSVTVGAVDASGRTFSAFSQTLTFAPPAPTNVGCSIASSGESSTISWFGSHDIVGSYVVQRLDPGSTSWSTISTISPSSYVAGDFGDAYTFTDDVETDSADPLIPSAIGGDGGYAYRVAAKGGGATSDASGTPGISQYVDAFELNPSTPTSLVYENGNSYGTGVTGSWPLSGSLHNGDSTTFTVANLPPHMSFDLMVYGTVTGDGESGDVITMTGPTGTQASSANPSPNFMVEVKVPDLDQTTGATFTVSGTLAGDSSRTWAIQSTLVYVHRGSITMGNATVAVGDVTEVPVHFSANDITDGTYSAGASDIVLNVKNYDPSILKPLLSTVTLDADGDGILMIHGVGLGSSPIALQDSIGDEAVTAENSSLSAVAASVLAAGGTNQAALVAVENSLQSDSNVRTNSIAVSGTVIAWTTTDGVVEAIDTSALDGELSMVTVTDPTTPDSNYELSFPCTNIGGSGGDTVLDNLQIPVAIVNAANQLAAVLIGITGSLTDVNTGQTINWPDPSNISVTLRPVTSGNTPVIVEPIIGFFPVRIPIDPTSHKPKPNPGQDHIHIPVETEQSLSLTVMDAANPSDSQTSNDGTVNDLYVSEEMGGTVSLLLTSADENGPGQGNISWSISGDGAGASSGDFSDSPVSVTLTPGDHDYDITATEDGLSATVDVHILDLTASTETAGNTPGADLSKTDQLTTGAFVPIDSFDQDYSGYPDYFESQVTGGTHSIVGETELLKVTLHKVGGSNPGYYNLFIPSNIQVYKNPDATDQVTNQNLDASVDNTLYIQGVIPEGSGPVPYAEDTGGWATGILRAAWTNGTTTLSDADSLRVTTFEMQGAQDVPGGGAYSYNVEGAIPGAASWLLSPDAKSMGTLMPSAHAVSVTWKNNAVVAHLALQVNPSYVWQMDVNVVAVNIVSSSMNCPTEPGQLLGLYPTISSSPLFGLGIPGINISAQVTAIGPVVNGQMRGVKYIQLGFIQNAAITMRNGVYANGDTYKAPYQGNTYYVDCGPSGRPWYDNLSPGFYGQGNDEPISQTLTMNDTPTATVRLKVLHVGGKTYPLTIIHALDSFNTFVCAATTYDSLSSRSIYAPEVEGKWHFNGSGLWLATSGTWTSLTGVTGDVVDSNLGAVTDKVITSGPIGNDVLNGSNSPWVKGP